MAPLTSIIKDNTNRIHELGKGNLRGGLTLPCPNQSIPQRTKSEQRTSDPSPGERKNPFPPIPKSGTTSRSEFKHLDYAFAFALHYITLL